MAKKKLPPRTAMPERDPAERIADFREVGLGYDWELALAEAARCLQCKKATCIEGCPVEVDIKAFIGHLQNKDLESAYRAILHTNSLPAVCGRVCPQEIQCEGACVLAKTGEPVAIGRLERFVADTYAAGDCEVVSDQPVCPVMRDDVSVGVVGSGPAGLTCAGFLASRGIPVTVYEALHEPGGVLAYGIPEFRLPKSVVKREVEAMASLGVEMRLNWVGGKTIDLASLRERHDAVFAATGAGLPRFLGIPGENSIGIYSANEFLTRANLGRAFEFPTHDTPPARGRKAIILGAGNVAMDAARTALRLGATEVTVVYRRTQDEMPARKEEIHHALEEGVKLEILNSPVEFLSGEDGRLRGIRLQRMALGDPDESGRRKPKPVEGDIWEMECDLAVVAVGAGPNRVLLEAAPELDLNERGYIKVNEETGETSVDGVYAGGDIVTGAATVILAMGTGRRAARAIAERLGAMPKEPA